ncbi:hypothetical protein HAX54_022796 [Datura stramonium]|uniref:HAT C-terminal dimerisation domain-containing protein n=1 Tax=Datura stramonium TaxID=4076 RepID=A0ABS8UW54_DATST|nr:hypothetical protein [Datura stramonium]
MSLELERTYNVQLRTVRLLRLMIISPICSDIAERRFSSKWIFDFSAISMNKCSGKWKSLERRVERSRKMAEAKERNLTPAIPSDMQSLMKRCENLEKEVRSLKLNLAFMNRTSSKVRNVFY